jgi:hypothetical protein
VASYKVASKDLNNIFLKDTSTPIKYTSKSGGGSKKLFPERNREEFGNFLKRKLEAIWENTRSIDSSRTAVTFPTRKGAYIEFEGEQGYDLVTKSLESSVAGIKLLNVRSEKIDEKTKIDRATVFVPKGKENFFVNKINEYMEENNKISGKPKNEKLVASIADIKIAVFESFWIGKKEWMPSQEALWCELWLNINTDESEKTLRDTLSILKIESKEEVLKFPEKRVIICKANAMDLQNLIEASEYIAEMRRVTETTAFFIELENKYQTDWANNLLSRLQFENQDKIHISILDTGVNNGHLLLKPILTVNDCNCFEKDWGNNDHDGHGTSMAGVCAYGDLQNALEDTHNIKIGHSLESYKILPPRGENEPHLYGAITEQSISRLIIDNPERIRIICMAITAPKFDTADGSPSSWSAALDELTSGSFDEIKKLFFVSAGNTEFDDWTNYPISNKTSPVQNPGQSWNAVTVGAYTNFDKFGNDKYANAIALAKAGGLSPYSTTSLSWDSKWPIKPEIVLEGGNVIKDSHGCFTSEDLSVLTTYYKPLERQFETFHATSAATAQAAWMAAKIQVRYPNAWSETIRAMMIHSANWTEEMKRQFLIGTNKGDYNKLLRCCGYGVPDLEIAIKSMENNVNLIIQSELQPFDKKDYRYITKDMHIHEIPWPKEVLESLFDTPIQMKITLSYFIEPGPGEVGWKDRYRYASCALRFDVNGSNTREMFIKSISKAMNDESENVEKSGGGGVAWILGPTNRNVGSIHSDTWTGTAALLATSNLIAVYPATGWWKERAHLGRWDKKIRYSLVISISTPKQGVDLYTPILTKIELKNKIEIKV